MLRRQRRAKLETDLRLAAYVTDRLSEGWTPEQIARRLWLGIETGLRAVCAETIYGWIYRAGHKAGRLWRFLTRRRARRRKRHGRASRGKRRLRPTGFQLDGLKFQGSRSSMADWG